MKEKRQCLEAGDVSVRILASRPRPCTPRPNPYTIVKTRKCVKAEVHRTPMVAPAGSLLSNGDILSDRSFKTFKTGNSIPEGLRIGKRVEGPKGRGIDIY